MFSVTVFKVATLPVHSLLNARFGLTGGFPPSLRGRRRPQERQLPLESAVNGPARTVLSGENADTRAVTNLIGAVVEIHHRAAQFDRAGLRQLEALGDAGVDLDVVGQITGIREFVSKSAAINPIDAESESLPAIRGA